MSSKSCNFQKTDFLWWSAVCAKKKKGEWKHKNNKQLKQLSLVLGKW